MAQHIEPANPRATVLAKISKGNDIETHMRRVEVDDVSFIEFRDYIPSLNEYRRGYWFPDNRDTLLKILEALVDIAEAE